jgi:hypothetical protein
MDGSTPSSHGPVQQNCLSIGCEDLAFTRQASRQRLLAIRSEPEALLINEIDLGVDLWKGHAIDFTDPAQGNLIHQIEQDVLRAIRALVSPRPRSQGKCLAASFALMPGIALGGFAEGTVGRRGKRHRQVEIFACRVPAGVSTIPASVEPDVSRIFLGDSPI